MKNCCHLQDLLLFRGMTRWGEFDDLYRISDLDRSQIPASEATNSRKGKYQTLTNGETSILM